MNAVDDWGLSWIQEELKHLDFSGLECEATDDVSVQLDSFQDANKSTLFPKLRDGFKASATNEIIYASINVSPTLQHSRDATRFLTEKYDTLGRVKITKPQMVNTPTIKNQDSFSPPADPCDVLNNPSPIYEPNWTSQTDESTSKEEFSEKHHLPVTSDYHTKNYGCIESLRVSSPVPPNNPHKLAYYEDQSNLRYPGGVDSTYDTNVLSTLSRKYMAGCELVPNKYDEYNEINKQNNFEVNNSLLCDSKSGTSDKNDYLRISHNGVSGTSWSSPTYEYLNGNSTGSEIFTGESAGQNAGHLTEQEIVQVEMFYRSRNTDVFVCKCSADLLIGRPGTQRVSTTLSGQTKRLSIVSGRPTTAVGSDPVVDMENWTHLKSGIPVVVMDTGDSRRQRRLNIVLAERGTGFTLWKDSVDYLTDYNAVSINFHTMHLSSDHTRLAGLRFDKPIFAGEFAQRIHKLTMNPADSLFNLAGSKKSKQVKKQKTKFRRPSKADISVPCCMTHITKLDPTDGEMILRGDNRSDLT